MAERFVYLNGDYVPEGDAKVSVLDRGFRWGDAVYDATRTFDGCLFKLTAGRHGSAVMDSG
jgi:branched-subunit amino acid aminotransferase/4-amino-4-deoxychorismate lyase